MGPPHLQKCVAFLEEVVEMQLVSVEMTAQLQHLADHLKEDTSPNMTHATCLVPFFQMKPAYKAKGEAVQKMKISWHINQESLVLAGAQTNPGKLMIHMMQELGADIKVGAPQETGMEKAAQVFLQKQRGD